MSVPRANDQPRPICKVFTLPYVGVRVFDIVAGIEAAKFDQRVQLSLDCVARCLTQTQSELEGPRCFPAQFQE